MATKIYCLASPKGGSGKTILCASFAAFIAGLDKRVLIIDVDEATHGLTLLFLNEVNDHLDCLSIDQGRPGGLFDGEPFDSSCDIVHLTNGVDFIPATFDFKIAEGFTDSQLHLTLSEVLNGIKENYDYIFLDAQAGADSFSQVVMRKGISDEVIIVTEYDPLCAAGVERLKGIMRDELTYVRTWILLNKMLPEFVDTFSDFLEISKYLSPIPWDADVVRALSRRRLPLDFENGNIFTLAVMQTLKGLLGTRISSQIDAWAKSRASSIREPIEEQYRDAELELEGLLESKLKFEQTKDKRLTLIMIFGTLLPIFIITLNILGYDYKLFRIEVPALLLILLIPILIITFMIPFKTYFSHKKIAEKKVTEARLFRQINIIEDKLKRLEILRKADLRTLIKERKSG